MAAGARERTLIYIPVIHTQADMGGLADSVRRENVRRLGRRKWKHTVAEVGRFWDEVERAINGLELAPRGLRVYQDGLPVCGREEDIVRELAEAGSRNHQLLLELKERGATLMGTESPELLLEEYELVKQCFASGAGEAPPALDRRQRALSASLLCRRDQFIARRIGGTLRAGDTGILFLGLLHSVGSHLDPAIRVSYPVGEPPRNKGEAR